MIGADQGPQIFGACVSSIFLALLIVIVRIWVRISIVKQLWADDYVITAAAVSLTSTQYMQCVDRVTHYTLAARYACTDGPDHLASSTWSWPACRCYQSREQHEGPSHQLCHPTIMLHWSVSGQNQHWSSAALLHDFKKVQEVHLGNHCVHLRRILWESALVHKTIHPGNFIR